MRIIQILTFTFVGKIIVLNQMNYNYMQHGMSRRHVTRRLVNTKIYSPSWTRSEEWVDRRGWKAGEKVEAEM